MTSATVLYLIDARTGTERQVLRAWLASNAPTATSIELADTAELGRAIAEATAAGDDPVLAPLGVAWLPPLRDGARRFRIRDTLTPGDPHHPPAWVQKRLLAGDPQRADVMEAETALLSDVIARWQARATHRQGGPERAAAFVARQARVALQRAATARFGASHKVPLEVRAEVLDQARFDGGIQRFADATGRPPEEVLEEATGYLDEMVASLNRHAVDITAEVAHLYQRGGMRGRVHTDPAQIEMITATAAAYPTVFLPSHRSYLDSTVLAIVLRDHGLPPNHRLGGANMALGPFAFLGRRNGIIYIRRSFRDNELYKWVLREYLGYLASKRFSLEWNIEGTRSRTGKMGPPRLGLLSYVAGAYLDGRCDDYRMIPVSIVYDELVDVEEYARYARGEAKRGESVRSMVSYIRRNRRFYGLGDMYVRFGEPVSLRELLGPPTDGDHASIDLTPVANEVSVRINDATPITPTALVALVLLSSGRALTMAELRMALDYMVSDIHQRNLPLINADQLTSDHGVEQAMVPLTRHRVITRVSDGLDEVYAITDEQRLVASYYRNTVLHHFIHEAIAQVALLTLTTTPIETVSDPVETVLVAARRLRDLLRFDFFFPADAEFDRRVTEALSGQSRTWRATLRSRGADGAMELLAEWRPLVAPVVLRAIIEAYLVVAMTVRRGGTGGDVVNAALRYGRLLLVQGRIRQADSVSALLFDSGAKLIAEEGPIVSELSAIAQSLTTIQQLAEAQFLWQT